MDLWSSMVHLTWLDERLLTNWKHLCCVTGSIYEKAEGKSGPLCLLLIGCNADIKRVASFCKRKQFDFPRHQQNHFTFPRLPPNEIVTSLGKVDEHWHQLCQSLHVWAWFRKKTKSRKTALEKISGKKKPGFAIRMKDTYIWAFMTNFALHE